MEAEVLRFVRAQDLLPPGSRVTCAVSGGADSMALLRCLLALREPLGLTVEAAHFNHLLRGEASDGDEAFVRDRCRAWGVPLRVGRGDAAAAAKAKGCSLETAARELRYAFLLEASGLIATAHQADDNAETVLMNLLRGAGARGLAGIPPRRDRIVRPLLCVTRADVLRYLRETGTPWREDASNAVDDCRRNRIRHHVLPLLRAENPGVSRAILTAGLHLRAEDEWMAEEAAAAEERARRPGGWDAAALRALPDALLRRVLLALLRAGGEADSTHTEAVLRLLRAGTSGRTGLPGRRTAAVRGGLLRITGPDRPAPLGIYPLRVPGRTEIPALSLTVDCFFLPPGEKFSKMSDTILLNYDMIGENLCVRGRRTGDAVTLPGGHRTLKRLMIDRNIPAEVRDRVPVLACEGRVLAVRGLCVSRDCLPQADTAVLAVRFQDR